MLNGGRRRRSVGRILQNFLLQSSGVISLSTKAAQKRSGWMFFCRRNQTLWDLIQGWWKKIELIQGVRSCNVGMRNHWGYTSDGSQNIKQRTNHLTCLWWNRKMSNPLKKCEPIFRNLIKQINFFDLINNNETFKQATDRLDSIFKDCRHEDAKFC